MCEQDWLLTVACHLAIHAPVAAQAVHDSADVVHKLEFADAVGGSNACLRAHFAYHGRDHWPSPPHCQSLRPAGTEHLGCLLHLLRGLSALVAVDPGLHDHVTAEADSG